ncbi:MAG TPA: hypothetical protein VN810_09020, partial [Terriglobales bacterium]|nr:hypothetical protein [Terriglobales bacterium]
MNQPVAAARRFHLVVVLALAGIMMLAGGCAVGPNYRRPAATAPQVFKEPPPEGWKEAQPNAGTIRGKW